MRTLFDDLPDPPPRRRGKKTIQERFEEFHAAHPDVYELFKRFAFQLLRAGRRRIGGKALIERIRWEFHTSSSGECPKLNDHYTSRYIRMLVAEHPEFGGKFELRKIRTP